MSDKIKVKSTNGRIAKILPNILIVCGIIGLAASFMLTADKIHLLKDPSFDPVCNINPLFSCLSVMKTEQAEVFGLPNTLFGIIGFTAIITVGVMLKAGASAAKWFWQLFNLGSAGGIAAVAYLFYQSTYTIGAICPFCVAVWAVTIPIFIYATLYNFETGYLKVPAKLLPAEKFAKIGRAHV